MIQNKNNLYFKKGKKTMEIIRTDIADLKENKKAFYRLTESVSISVQDMTDDQYDDQYDVLAYLLYTDTDSKGKEREILTIQTDKGLFTTVSKTFKESFFKIVDLMDGDPFAIRMFTGTSNSGKTYVDCRMVSD